MKTVAIKIRVRNTHLDAAHQRRLFAFHKLVDATELMTVLMEKTNLTVQQQNIEVRIIVEAYSNLLQLLIGTQVRLSQFHMAFISLVNLPVPNIRK